MMKYLNCLNLDKAQFIGRWGAYFWFSIRNCLFDLSSEIQNFMEPNIMAFKKNNTVNWSELKHLFKTQTVYVYTFRSIQTWNHNFISFLAQSKWWIFLLFILSHIILRKYICYWITMNGLLIGKREL
jgi:hypothetical protein